MKPIFTVHAGEYLVGSYIEQKFKGYNVWVPSKDTGIDLLVTDKTNKKTVTLQVKFSKDFLVAHMAETFQAGLSACGWWTLNSTKLKQSKADLWIFVLHAFDQKNLQFIVIPPKELLKRLRSLHGNLKLFQTYLWVTKKNKCWETRGLKKKDQVLVANNLFSSPKRDFTKYLNNWDLLKKAK